MWRFISKSKWPEMQHLVVRRLGCRPGEWPGTRRSSRLSSPLDVNQWPFLRFISGPLRATSWPVKRARPPMISHGWRSGKRLCSRRGMLRGSYAFTRSTSIASCDAGCLVIGWEGSGDSLRKRFCPGRRAAFDDEAAIHGRRSNRTLFTAWRTSATRGQRRHCRRISPDADGRRGRARHSACCRRIAVRDRAPPAR